MFFLICHPTFGGYVPNNPDSTTYRVIENLFHALMVFKIIRMFCRNIPYTLVYLSFGYLK